MESMSGRQTVYRTTHRAWANSQRMSRKPATHGFRAGTRPGVSNATRTVLIVVEERCKDVRPRGFVRGRAHVFSNAIEIVV
jgi:hypothetical protein